MDDIHPDLIIRGLLHLSYAVVSKSNQIKERLRSYAQMAK
jgi:hypothetical protein